MAKSVSSLGFVQKLKLTAATVSLLLLVAVLVVVVDSSVWQPSFEKVEILMPKNSLLVQEEKNSTDHQLAGADAGEAAPAPAPHHHHHHERAARAAAAGAWWSSLECDLADPRSDTCELHGDVRIHLNSTSLILAENPPTPQSAAAAAGRFTSLKVRPYARKWESFNMASVKEVTVRALPRPTPEILRCDDENAVTNNVPAVVFSTGSLQGNFYHDLSDVLIPLYLTTRRYAGEVHLLIVQHKRWWVDKYRPILSRLSRYDIIDLDDDDDATVRCFRHALVGLKSHRELGIEPIQPPQGYSMLGFKKFLRDCFSLKRESIVDDVAITASSSSSSSSSKKKKKPRLLFMLREGTRSLINEGEVIELARAVGFEVVLARPNATRDLTRFAGVVNSCDFMIGVHGAGLTHHLLMPANATVIQIIPYGDLKWLCWVYYGDTALRTGLRYFEYQVEPEETSLLDEYHRNHTVFTDPQVYHKQGYHVMFKIYMTQRLRLDLHKFRKVLIQALNSA